jgi:hypothetical protein
VERTFPVHSPSIAKLEVVTRGKVRRAKLYYLRELRGKKARIRERRVGAEELQAVQAVQADEGEGPQEPQESESVEASTDGEDAAEPEAVEAPEAAEAAEAETVEVPDTTVDAESKG